MNRCLSTVLIVLFVACTWQTAFADSALIQYSGNGHYYQRFDDDRTWSGARTYCEGRGAHLATLTSQGEQDFVFQNVGQQGVNIWLGGSDENSEGNWEWITGETWSYINWDSGQPDDWSAGQDYLIFWGAATIPGQWDDNGPPEWIDASFPFVCEWDQPLRPTAVLTMTEWGMIIFIALAGLGSVFHLRRQRRA